MVSFDHCFGPYSWLTSKSRVLTVEITVLLDKVEQIKPAAFAIARSFPLFTKKSKETKARTVATKFVLPNAEVVSDDLLAQVQIFADGVRETARLVDMPWVSLLKPADGFARSRSTELASSTPKPTSKLCKSTQLSTTKLL